MIKKISIVIFSFFFFLAGAQNWAPVSVNKPNNILQTLLFDSIHNELIISDYNFYMIGSLPARGVARWNGIRWDSLAGGINTHDLQFNPNNPNGAILCGIPYNGKFLMGGVYYSIGGKSIKSIATWDGLQWDSLPVPISRFTGGGGPPIVAALLQKNNQLFIAGGFDTIAGQASAGLAVYDGVSFTPFVVSSAFMSPSGYFRAFDIKEYKNEIYVCGVFYDTNADTIGHIMRYNGTNWYSVGGGIHGSICQARTMAIYNNELYIGGYFKKAAGNAGECIMKWNGSQWSDVGFGLQPNYGTVYRLVVHHNKLWAFGSFNFASDMHSFSAAVYDGIKWCAPQDTLNNFIFGAAVFNDSIYVGGTFTNGGGDTNVKYIAKLKDPNLYKSCNGVGIKENNNLNNSISIYPNPVSNSLHIESEQYFGAGSAIEITNTLGQTVLKLPYSNEIDVSNISNGCYFLKITTNNNQSFHSKFVKE